MSPSDELFPAESVQMDSPRLAWMKRHGVETEHNPHGGTECPETGSDIPHWVCRVIKPHPNFSHYSPRQIAGGDTEDEAITNWALNAGVPLWNEEEAAGGSHSLVFHSSHPPPKC